MFLWDWITGVLRYFGMYKKSGKLVFVGLDNAGKTTLLFMLRDDRLGQHTSTVYPTKEELTLGGITFSTFDLGGHVIVRRVWKDYFVEADAIVFMIDANDRARFEESRDELAGILDDEQVADVPILILGNKIDISGAASEEEVRKVFALQGVTTGKGKVPKKDLYQRRPIELFMCSVKKKEGYGEGFRWLSQYLN